MQLAGLLDGDWRQGPGGRTVRRPLVRLSVSSHWDRNLHNRFAGHAYVEWFGQASDQVRGIFVRVTDIAEHKRMEDALFEEKERMHLTLKAIGNAVMCIDLDGFKQVNDTLGHDGSDELLVQIAQRLTEAGGSFACMRARMPSPCGWRKKAGLRQFAPSVSAFSACCTSAGGRF